MSPHFHQRLCLTAVNNHFEDSQYPQVSSTEPPRPAICSGRVNHEDTNTEVFVRGGRLKESWWTLRLGATWLRLHGFYLSIFFYLYIFIYNIFSSSLTWILSPGYQHRKRDPKKNERKTFRAASQLQIKSWKKYFLNTAYSLGNSTGKQTEEVLVTPSLRHCSNKYKLAREGEKL